MDNESINKIKDVFTSYGFNILSAIAILFIGYFAAGILRAIIRSLLQKRKMDATIVTFLTSLIYIGLMIFVAIAAVNRLGVQTASFVAVLGAAGLAIGLALQGSLANFAAGFLLIMFRPFKAGDYIEGGGTAGIVDEIQLFTTILKTPDNKKVIIPNAKLTGDNIINYSALNTRRLDLKFGVSYSDNIDKVRQVLQRIKDEDPRILKDPPPMIVVSELADSSVNFILRVWVKNAEYWNIQFDTIEKVKKAFDREGITIPFPQRDVHVFQRSNA